MKFITRNITPVITYLLILSTFMLTPAFASAQNTIKEIVNNNSAGRTDITLPVTDGTHTTSLPVTVIKGTQPGSIFTVLAGIHGYEYPPIIAVQELMSQIDYTRLNGTLIIVPIANTASFYGRTPFVSPLDHKNLNNLFPGNPDGSVTQQIAAIITHDIISLSNVLVDVHGGDASEDLLPFVCYYNNTDNPLQTRQAARLCEVSGFETIVSYPYNLTPEEPAVYAFKQAVQDGKTALSIESGKLGNVQPEAVQEIKTSIFNMLAELGMYPILPASNTILPTSVKHYTEQSYVKCTTQGIFYSDYKAGDLVKKDDRIGYVTDVFGNKIQEITAPASGIILYKTGTPPVNTGETMFCIAYD